MSNGRSCLVSLFLPVVLVLIVGYFAYFDAQKFTIDSARASLAEVKQTIAQTVGNKDVGYTVYAENKVPILKFQHPK